MRGALCGATYMHLLVDMRIEYWSDNGGRWYADGLKLDRNSNHNQQQQADVPRTTQVIAVRCHDSGGGYGIAARLANGVVTDESWKCTSNEPDGDWTRIGYDDAAWPRAVINAPPRGVFSNGEPYNVIWADCDGRRDGCMTVYCRKAI